ncbi:MAG: hypothetical protein EXR75_10290, partial [Myxococcales bacterium]|nr:hypothetical protein [Myxococcales bacterium]
MHSKQSGQGDGQPQFGRPVESGSRGPSPTHVGYGGPSSSSHGQPPGPGAPDPNDARAKATTFSYTPRGKTVSALGALTFLGILGLCSGCESDAPKKAKKAGTVAAVAAVAESDSAMRCRTGLGDYGDGKTKYSNCAAACGEGAKWACDVAATLSANTADKAKLTECEAKLAKCAADDDDKPAARDVKPAEVAADDDDKPAAPVKSGAFSSACTDYVTCICDVGEELDKHADAKGLKSAD